MLSAVSLLPAVHAVCIVLSSAVSVSVTCLRCGSFFGVSLAIVRVRCLRCAVAGTSETINHTHTHQAHQAHQAHQTHTHYTTQHASSQQQLLSCGLFSSRALAIASRVVSRRNMTCLSICIPQHVSLLCLTTVWCHNYYTVVSIDRYYSPYSRIIVGGTYLRANRNARTAPCIQRIKHKAHARQTKTKQNT